MTDEEFLARRAELRDKYGAPLLADPPSTPDYPFLTLRYKSREQWEAWRALLTEHPDPDEQREWQERDDGLFSVILISDLFEAMERHRVREVAS